MKISFKKKKNQNWQRAADIWSPTTLDASTESFKGRLLLRACVHGHGVFRWRSQRGSVVRVCPSPLFSRRNSGGPGGHCLPESRHEEQSSEPLVSVWLAAGKIITGSSSCGGLPFRSQDLGRRGQVDLYEFQARGFNATNRAIERDPV